MHSSEKETTGHMKRGFVWLGAASAVTRVLDATFTLGVLWFVSREELALATLAWSIGVFLEAFNGLGIGTALVQTKSVDDEMLSDVHWYTLFVAAVLVAATWLFAPGLAHLWGSSALVP